MLVYIHLNSTQKLSLVDIYTTGQPANDFLSVKLPALSFNDPMYVSNTEERKGDYVGENVENVDGEVLETKYACEYYVRSPKFAPCLTISPSSRTMDGGENFLEGHALLHDPQLGCTK
jgi:hypothetical protein